jgi:hypothetical protein
MPRTTRKGPRKCRSCLINSERGGREKCNFIGGVGNIDQQCQTLSSILVPSPARLRHLSVTESAARSRPTIIVAALAKEHGATVNKGNDDDELRSDFAA